ncbi:uncharacterized protein UHOD_00115 [Ustilago sp. UG-2017b]|nr:uncharacterized protein UHOD_00115 [Ustilago sp. UG-2017b]
MPEEKGITATHDDGQPAKRKRLRIPKSCIPCLKGKRACDRGRPACGRCTRSGQSNDCSYDPRLPQHPASGGSSFKRNATYDDLDDDDQPDASSPDNRQLALLERELEEARNETRRLQHLLRTQQSPAAPASPRSYSSPQHRPHSHWSHASTSADRHRAHSSANDLHAARGLQMLAEIAGPQHQDADSNAVKSRILHWSSPASHASPSSQLSPIHRPASASSRDSMRPINEAASSPAPDNRYAHNSATSSIYNSHFQRRSSKPPQNTDDLDSLKNINGTRMYYGESTSGDKVLRKVAASTASSSRSPTGNVASSIHETMARRDMQSAFNSVLDPSRDTFPFATIWSSGTAFIEEVLPFFPKPEDFDSICASFVRHFSAMCPALTIPTAIDYARTFSRMDRKQQSQVSLPWLAVFLMICALGKNCDSESTTVGVDRKVRMLDAFLAGEASQQPSRASSPIPTADGEAQQQSSSNSTKSPAMVSDLFLSAAYQSLRLCSFLSAPTLQTIHSQLLIGAYLLNTERAASFWPLLGSVARQAQSIGLHVDPNKIKRDWDPIEADTRRRLWWAVVHQDVILSSIFGRPLGITRFSCRFPGTAGVTTYATLQCEFSQFARIYLDENQDRSWSQEKIIDFTEKVLSWYANIPERYRPDIGRINLLGSGEDEEAIQNYAAAGVDIETKGLIEVHQSGNLAVEVFYILLSLHRSNLFPSSSSDDAPTKPPSSASLNKTSLHICTQALRRITRAQTTMIDLLSRARATMFWKIAYYTYQAAIAGAYIVFVKPQSKQAESALEDLAILVDFFDRLPERWTGLKMAKHGLRVLRKLAVAAREMPEAASIVRSANGEENGVVDEASAGSGVNGSLNGMSEVSVATPTTTQHSFGPTSNGTGDALKGGAFLPPIFGNPFLSPNGTGSSQAMMMGSNNAMLPTNNNLPSSIPPTLSMPTTIGFNGEPTSLFTSALTAAASTGSPLPRSLANVPLVTLFNNTYDQQEVGGKQFCYDPFVPDPTYPATSVAGGEAVQAVGSGGGRSSNSPSTSDRMTSSISFPSTAFSTHNGAGVVSEREKAREGERMQVAAAAGGQEGSPTPGLNQKDLATYWSEYFSLQLDWDRLTGLA